MKDKFDTNGQIEVQIEGGNAVLTKEHLGFQQKIVNVMEQKYVPSVIEPSFGIGRIITCIFEHSFKMRD